MNVRTIESDADYRSAMDRIERLMDLEEPTRDQQNEIELLSLAIEAHERKTVSIDPPDPIEAIKFHMDQAGLDVVDIVHCFGGRTGADEVLSGHRALDGDMIRALDERLGIPADLLLERASAHRSEPCDDDGN